MLYITNIDDCNFSMYGNSIGVAGLKVHSKKNVAAKAIEPVYNESVGRIKIYDSDSEEQLVSQKPVSEITLDGIVYATAQGFVVNFNKLMAECDGSGSSSGAYSANCNDWQIGTTESASKTFNADTINSITIIIESGTVNVSNGTENTDLITGQSITISATNLLAQDVVIDATSGKAIWVILTCDEEITTTTTIEMTTTTT